MNDADGKTVVASKAARLDPLSPPRVGNGRDGIQMQYITNKQLLTADKRVAPQLWNGHRTLKSLPLQ
jgi:hypothetical protein